MRMLVLLLASTSIIAAGCAGDRDGYRTTSQSATTTTSQTTGSAMDPTGTGTRMATGRSNVSDSGTVPNVGTPGTSGGAVPPGGLASAAVLSNPDDVRLVQNRLRQLNYYGGEMNGLWNADTELAVRNFQRANGLPGGRLDQQTLRAMGLSSVASGNGQLANVEYMREPRMARQPTQMSESDRMARMQQMSESDRMAHMRQMHEQLHREMDQRQGMSNISPSAGPGAGVTGRNLDAQSVRQVQQKLAGEGYYKIPVDGIWGPKSQDALVQFQDSRNLPATGRITPQTVSAMGLDSSALRSKSGTPIMRQ